MYANATILLYPAKQTGWKNLVRWYREELENMKNRLLEVSSGKNHPGLFNDALHFEQQLVVEQIRVNELDSELKRSKKTWTADLNLGTQKIKYNGKERGIIRQFEDHFSELRKDFNSFCANWA